MQQLRTAFSNLSVFEALDRMVRAFFGYLKEHTGPVFWTFLGLVLFSWTGMYFQQVWMISLAGLLWLLLFAILFLVVVTIVWFVDFLKGLLQELEASPVPELYKQLAGRLFAFVQQFTYTTAALLVVLAHLVCKLHISAASAPIEPVPVLGDRWFSLLWGFSALVAGVIDDFRRRRQAVGRAAEQGGGGAVYFFGAAQLYASFIILITGLLGGGAALTAVHQVIRNPLLLIQHDLLEVDYLFSYSRTILDGLGSFFFLFFYLFLPFGVAYLAQLSIRQLRQGLKVKFPMAALLMFRNVSYAILPVGLIVSWSEGWIGDVFRFILNAMGYLFYWIGSLF
ncbi:MAG: hypothetical protein IT260_22805 [Saprospiraceae bacterium]|nr:hypothetical protein [Saprospiraceae bacterium]